MSLKELPLFSQVDNSTTGTKRDALTVSQLTSQIKGKLEPQFADVWIKGEISNYRPASSGHAYFSLKDASACISAAIFGWGARNKKNPRQAFDLHDGLEVICHGKVTIYPPRGSYQITIDSIEPLGAGALQLAFEQLKAKLATEGLFEQKKKRRLPSYPNTLAVITSPSGAAIKDMLNILKRRAPHINIVVVPALVQGDGAAAQIIKALELVNKHKLGQIVVLARGGGSIEDLWCFNDEELARAISRSGIPTISAVGHEIDFTISDFVADIRAPTPSAAAEIVSGYWVDSQRQIKDSLERIKISVLRNFVAKKQLISHISARLISPKDKLREHAQRCDELYSRIERGIRLRLESRRASLEKILGKLDALSPLKVLERGYSIVCDTSSEKRVVKSASQVTQGQELEVKFYDGAKKVLAL